MELLKRKNILFITPTFFPNSYFGGSIYSSYKMCNDLSEIYNVTVISSNQHNRDSSPYKNDFKKYKKFNVRFCAEEIKGKFSLSFFWFIIKNNKKYDLFYVNDFFSIYGLISICLGLLYKKITILAPRGSFSDYTIKRNKTFIKKFLINLLLQISKNSSLFRFHATSKLEKKEIINFNFKNRIYIIPNLFNISRYKRIKSHLSKTKISKSHIRISFFGRIDPKKHFSLFVDLSEYFNKNNLSQNYEFCIAGANTFYKNTELNQILSKSNCKYFGQLSLIKKFKFINDSDMLFFLSENENFGNSAFEFLLFDKPIMLLKNNLWSNFDDKNIIVVDTKNLNYLSETIINYFNKTTNFKTSNELLNIFSDKIRSNDYKEFFK